MPKKPDISRDDRIKKELRKLKALYKSIPKNRLKLYEKSIEEAAFMAIDLEDLRETVTKEGPVIRQKNGNGFTVTQEHPAQKSYNAMIGKYTALIDKLNELLPEEAANDALAAWAKMNE